MGHSRPLFLYFCLLNTVDSKQILLMTGFEPRTSGKKVTGLPTEPQPLPKLNILFVQFLRPLPASHNCSI